jgi:very-short-patch-repair endonuclease
VPITPSPGAGEGQDGRRFAVTAMEVQNMIPSPLAGEGRDGGMDRSREKWLRKNATDAERMLWKHLRLRQFAGYKFRRQQSLGNYIVDFVCLEKRLVIEVDGGQHYTQAAYDEQRSAWLESQGFRVLRFWDDEVMKDIESVKEVIWRALR